MEKRVMTGYSSEKFLSKFVKTSKNQLVQNLSEIRIKAPLVLKIMSPDALHKTDIGGIKIVQEQSQVKPAFKELISISKKKKLKIDGIMVQKFVDGEKIIIGIKKDPIFNHVIAFGLGGIFTEILEDISIRKCPITKKDTEEMISELKSRKVFQGFRGKKLDVKSLKDTLVKISKIPNKHPEISELDINPLMVNEKSCTVVDARIVFEK